MFKKDPIFWWASAIFVLSILTFALTQNQVWLALMIGAYLLRPTLASLGYGRRFVDERQMSIHYRSGNIAFAVMMIACILFIIKLDAENNHDWEMFVLVVCVGIATKALLNVILAKNWREGAGKIIIAAGLIMTLFEAMEAFGSGIKLRELMNLVPGLVIIAIGLLSRYYPRAVGVLIFAATAFLEFLIFSKGFTWGQIGTAVIIGVPLAAAGVCLFIGSKPETEPEMEQARAVQN